jgi:UPF0271 protein
VKVLDASAFIRDSEPEGRIATVPEVREELADDSGYRFEALAGGGMTVHVPDEPALARVRDAARASGDHDELSETDRRLLATALELDATLVTDDYAVQNVAARLDVPVEPVERDAIAEERSWQFQCQGCGRTFDEDPGRCPVCGSDCSRKS